MQYDHHDKSIVILHKLIKKEEEEEERNDVYKKLMFHLNPLNTLGPPSIKLMILVNRNVFFAKSEISYCNPESAENREQIVGAGCSPEQE